MIIYIARLHSQRASACTAWHEGSAGATEEQWPSATQDATRTFSHTRTAVCVGGSQADARVPCGAGRRRSSVKTETANGTH